MTNKHIINSQKTWDSIAKSFDSTRREPWRQCIDFINNLPKNSTVADIGCGNGRHLIPCSKQCKKVIGIDISKELLNIVQNKIDKEKLENVLLLQSDAVNISLKDNTVDVVLYIAALHNIKDRNNRIRSLKEVKRVLKKDGKVLISVWSRWQDKYRKEFLRKWFKKTNESEFGDIDIYWKQHGLNIPRFYHLYSKREFLKDIKDSKLEIIEIHDVKIHSKKHSDNYFAVLTKQ